MVLYAVSSILPVFTENLGNQSNSDGHYFLCSYRFLLKTSDRAGGISHSDRVIVLFL